MSGTPNYLRAGDINRSTRSHEIVDYLSQRGCSIMTNPNLDSESGLFNYHGLDNPNPDLQSSQSFLKQRLLGSYLD